MKKILNIAFCLLFVVLLALPAALTNFKKDQASERDNTYLPEIAWSEKVPIRDRIEEVEEYYNKRVGFRYQALDAYVVLNDRLFQLMDHPLYMYGKDHYVFCSADYYIADYQHLNLDEPWAEEFAGWMQRFSDISHSHGAEFYYTLIPDKKTVYEEFFPAGYNKLGDVSRTDQLLAALSKTDVDYVYALDWLLEAKKSMPVANVKYDAGHWNANGTFTYAQRMIELMRKTHPEIPPLERSEFEVTTVRQKYLAQSQFQINEDVPEYIRKNLESVSESEQLQNTLTCRIDYPKPVCYVDDQHPELPRLLIIHDSYLTGHEQYFQDHFSMVTMIHRDNVKGPHDFEAYLNTLQPDIVIFENPERSLHRFYFSEED